MGVDVLHGNALDLPVADNSVDLVVTSPPYFGLRSYQDNGEHYTGQLGDEATPDEFVDGLLAATREMMRVLKPSGSIFVNLGDKYSGSGPGPARTGTRPDGTVRLPGAAAHGRQGHKPVTGVPAKSLMGIPWRYALRCIDDLGLILRAEIVWSKPNGLPESVTDRVRRSHEQWFHFTTQPRYYANVDAIREPHVTTGRGSSWEARKANLAQRPGYPRQDDVLGMDNAKAGHALGKLPGSVWSVPTQPLRLPPELGVDHFAAFPMAWPRKFVQGWCPPGVCTACGQGRRAVVTQVDEAYAAERERVRQNRDKRTSREQDVARVSGNAGGRTNAGGYSLISNGVVRPDHRITGEACGCETPDAPTTPGVVLDPFGGTGTTATVAHALGRHGISVDLSQDYCRVARWRTSDPVQLARAAQTPAPRTTRKREGAGLW